MKQLFVLMIFIIPLYADHHFDCYNPPIPGIEPAVSIGIGPAWYGQMGNQFEIEAGIYILPNEPWFGERPLLAISPTIGYNHFKIDDDETMNGFSIGMEVIRYHWISVGSGIEYLQAWKNTQQFKGIRASFKAGLYRAVTIELSYQHLEFHQVAVIFAIDPFEFANLFAF